MAARKLLAFNATDAFHEEIAAADTTTLGGLTITPGNIDLSTTGKVINSAAPTAAGDLTNKAYVDGLLQGLTVKPPVNALADSNITPLSGLTTVVDGFALNTLGQRVLLTAQTTPSQNGIWVVAAGAWTRPTDFAIGSSAANAFTFVSQGATYADQGWVCTTDPPNDIVNTDSLTFVQFSSAGVILAGAGLQKSGNTISVKAGDGIETTSNTNATNVALDGSAPGLQFTGASPNGRLQVKANTTGGLEVVSAGVGIKIDTVTAGNPTLAVGANGARVLGLPSLFNINSVAVSANVTAANLGILTAGPASDASSLHTHTGLSATSAQSIKNSYVTADALAAGDPVYFTGTASQVGKALANTDSKARVIGLNDSNAQIATATAVIYSHGPNPGVLAGATPGTPYFLQSTGGYGTSVPAGGNRIIEIGVALSATDLWVRVLDFGKKP